MPFFYSQNTNTEFTQSKASNTAGAQREAMLKDLAAGFDGFMELKGNLEEGTKVGGCVWLEKSHSYHNKNPFVWSSERRFGLTKGGQLRNVIMDNIIRATKTESFVYCWLRAHTVFDIT